MSSNFIYSTRDHKFIIKEWLDIKKILNYPKFKGFYEEEDIDAILEQALKVAKEVIAPTNDDGENIGARLVDGRVKLPESFKRVYEFMNENGWGTENPTEEGCLPATIHAACREYFGGANPAMAPYIGLTSGASKLIETFGKQEDKDLFLPRMYEGR